MIEIKNIQLSFPSKVLIKSGDINIPSGQITGIIGESGTGKTVLLQEIGLLRKDCHFDYVFDDMHINAYNDKQRAMARCQNISFVYQDVCFFQKMNLKENIEFFAMLTHKSLTEDDIHKLLDMVHLDFDLSTSIETMSGGEKQRLAILCGLIRDADLFIFDEPTAYLDASNTAIIIELLKDLAYQKKKMVLVATHDPRLIDVFDNIYQIHSQKLEITKKAEDNHIKHTRSPLRLSFQILRKYMSLTHFRYKSKFIMLFSIAGVICTLLALIFTYSQNYQSIMGAPLLDILHHEILVIKKDTQLITPYEQALIQRQLMEYETYNDYTYTAYINSTPVYIKAYYPHQKDTLPVMEQENLPASFNHKEVEDVYMTYGLYHTILNSFDSFTLKDQQNQTIEIQPSKVLNPHFDLSFNIYIPYETFMDYLYSTNIDLSKTGVQCINVYIHNLSEISNIQRLLPSDYDILDENNLMFHVDSARLFDSNYIFIIVVIVLIAFIIYKIYSLILEQQNIALLSSLGITSVQLIQIMTYKEGIHLLLSFICTCVMSALILMFLGLFSFQTWGNMILAASFCLILIFMIILIAFYIMIKVFPPYKLLK